MAASIYEKTIERAFRLLSYKPRTIAEMRERLLEKDWAEEAIVDQVIARLEELGYLDDEQFASGFAASRLAGKPVGRTRLRRDLHRKKLPTQVIEQTLDQAYEAQTEDQLIDRAIEKRIRLKGLPASREDSKKLFDYLMRRGFNYDLILRKIRRLDRNLSDDE